jgi:hypothetical protein
MSIIHFLLTPDRSSARRVRRMVAENSPRLGVMVGTWTELVEQVRTLGHAVYYDITDRCSPRK